MNVIKTHRAVTDDDMVGIHVCVSRWTIFISNNCTGTAGTPWHKILPTRTHNVT